MFFWRRFRYNPMITKNFTIFQSNVEKMFGYRKHSSGIHHIWSNPIQLIFFKYFVLFVVFIDMFFVVSYIVKILFCLFYNIVLSCFLVIRSKVLLRFHSWFLLHIFLISIDNASLIFVHVAEMTWGEVSFIVEQELLTLPNTLTHPSVCRVRVTSA